jgi:hypothetical protein
MKSQFAKRSRSDAKCNFFSCVGNQFYEAKCLCCPLTLCCHVSSSDGVQCKPLSTALPATRKKATKAKHIKYVIRFIPHQERNLKL